MNENTSAGPAPYRTTTPLGRISPAAAVPIDEKMPAPITAPIASITRSPAPITRVREAGPLSISPISAAIGLRWNSCDTRRDCTGSGLWVIGSGGLGLWALGSGSKNGKDIYRASCNHDSNEAREATTLRRR